MAAKHSIEGAPLSHSAPAVIVRPEMNANDPNILPSPPRKRGPRGNRTSFALGSRFRGKDGQRLVSKFVSRRALRRSFAIEPLQIWAFAVLLVVLLLALKSALAVGFLFERNYNEGWNVYNAARVLDHQMVYDDNYWRVNNYPICSFLIVAIVNFLVGNLVLSGRIVALISFTAIGALAGIAIRALGGKGIDAVFGAACALGFCYLVAPAWICVDDPQTLAEAVALGGFVTFISRPSGRVSLLAVAFLVVLGGFIKHNVVAIPIAITLDLAIRSPWRVAFWLALCAGWISAFLGLTQVVAGGAFLDHLLSPRIFTWHGVHYHLMKYLRLFKFPLITIIMGSRLIFTRQRFVLATWGITSIALATIFAGFEGTSYNMFQDAAVFLGITAGVMFCEVRKVVAAAPNRDHLAKVLAGCAALFLAQPIWTHTVDATQTLPNIGRILDDDRKAEASFIGDSKYIAATAGPAICESLLMCYTAGQPFILDPFNSRQYILANKLDQNQLLRRIGGREFTVIQLRADICDDPATTACHILHYPQKFNRFTDETLYAIDRYYKIDRRSPYGSFYVPK
jgi:hypothetical protein